MIADPLCPKCKLRPRNHPPSGLQSTCLPCYNEWRRAKNASRPKRPRLPKPSRARAAPLTVAERKALGAAGRLHVVERVSYALGVALCACGERLESDPRIWSIPARQEDLAERMNAHIAEANRRRLA